MCLRKAIVADQFYPGQRDSCIDQINHCLEAADFDDNIPEPISGGIVPHAGWIFSGPLAAWFFSCLRTQCEKVHTFILFGAAHSYFNTLPAVYDKGFWETPLGQVAVNQELAESVIKTGIAVSDLNSHQTEHSIEVQIPFIQYFFPGSKILPILVPPGEKSILLGESIGSIISDNHEKKSVFIGSTDLTHYGPRYGFTPVGLGQKALQWAHDVNDRKFIDFALKMEPNELLACAAENGNACGPGAAAATIAAAKKMGSKSGFLLGHTNSNEIMVNRTGQISSDSVGYAAIAF